MKTRATPSILLVVVLLVVAAVTEARHEPKKVPRIAFLGGFGTLTLTLSVKVWSKNSAISRGRISISSTDSRKASWTGSLSLQGN